MDIRHLRYFQAVAEAGSFSSAARSLGIAQPALSRHVKAIEDEHGVVLFRRNARGIQLTQEGERLLEFAGSLVRQFEMLPDVIGDPSEAVRGRVVVGFPTSVNAMVARPLIRAVMKRLPRVQLHVIESLSGFLQEWIEAGRLDICVLYDADPGRKLTLEHMQDEELWLIGGPGALPPGCAELGFADLERFRFTMPGAAHSLRRLLDRIARSQGVPLNIVVEIDSLTALKGIAEAENLVTLLPRGAAAEELRSGRLRACRIVSPTVKRSLSVATPAVRAQTRAATEVKKLIMEIGSARMVDQAPVAALSA